MAEWLVEQGIGEERAILLEGEQVLAARLHWPGALVAGQVEDARLVSFDPRQARGTAQFAGGEQALVSRLPKATEEGALLRLEVTRPALAERGRYKLALARPSTAPKRPAPTLAESLAEHGPRVVHRFPAGTWEELWSEAFEARVDFSSGSLDFAVTPAMTLIDVDGTAAPAALALAAVPAVARALATFDLGGSIGIDFPSLAGKEDRRRVDQALGEALSGWPHERTAMNGFGFVQIVARLDRASLLHKLTLHRSAAAARMLLRRAERLDGHGTALELSGHPALQPHLRAEWLEELARRGGRPVRWRADAALALGSPNAQFVGDE